MKTTLALRSFLLGTVFLSASPAAFAATFTWDGGGADGNFSSAANWTPNTAPGNLSAHIFNFGALVNPFQTTANHNFAGTPNPTSLTFTAALVHSMNITGNAIQYGTVASAVGPVNNSSFSQTLTAQSSVFKAVNFTGAGAALNVNQLSFRNDTTPLGYALTLNGAVGGTVTTLNITNGAPSIYSLIKADAGKWTIVSSAPYTGATTISGGTLEFQNSVSSSGITNNSALIFNNAGSQSYSNVIGGTGTLTKQGAGTFTLGGLNTYQGLTTISAGTLSASKIVVSGGNSNLGNAASAVTLGAAATQGTLSYTGNTDTYTRGLTIGGAGGGRLDVTTSGQTLTVGTGNVTGTGLFTVGGAGDTNITSNVTHTGGLTKMDAGKLTLAGTNTYTGATSVTGGVLAVNGSLANTSTTVGSTATLQGSGTIGGSVTVQNGGTLAAGNSIESLGTGALSFGNGSTFAYELQTNLFAGTPNLAGDLTYSTGTLDISVGSILTLTDLATSTALAYGSKLTLISYFGGWTSGELFTYNAATLNDGSTFTLGANQWRFDYDDLTGGPNFASNQVGAASFVTMTVIPEPRAALLGAIGLLALLRRRRA